MLKRDLTIRSCACAVGDQFQPFCLGLLVSAVDVIDASIAPEECPCLVEGEGHALTETLTACIENPFVVAQTGIRSGFSAAGDLFNLTAELLQIWTFG